MHSVEVEIEGTDRGVIAHLDRLRWVDSPDMRQGRCGQFQTACHFPKTCRLQLPSQGVQIIGQQRGVATTDQPKIAL